MLNHYGLGQTLVAAIGALILTVTMVGAAAGPARAIETAPQFAAAAISVQAVA